VKFKDAPDNASTPFIPILKTKPNAITPLPEYRRTEAAVLPAGMEAHINGLGFSNKPAPGEFAHPYEQEIGQLRFGIKHVTAGKETLYRPLQEVQCHWVDSESALRELADKLDLVTEFAVDLEHHNYRSYLGFTCLMQVSTRTEDFLVDTLELRHALHILNSSFSNPNIVKVLHGADMDIHWLQRDFGIYVVNLFDTGQALRVLECPSFGLQWLLKHYCDVEANKKYQTADWRTRPLSSEMLLYAREDTHYLLYVYDRMKNQLLEQSEARKVTQKYYTVDVHEEDGSEGTREVGHLLYQHMLKSKSVALRRYEKPLVLSNDHKMLCMKFNLVYTEPQMRALKDIYLWRDTIAREKDESIGYVMPNHVLINIINSMPLDSRQLLEVCKPATPLIRAGASEIVQAIHQAKLMPESPALSGAPATPGLTMPMAAFSLASPSPQQPQALPVSSPVLNEAELYQAAGWIGVSSGTHSGEYAGPRAPSGVPLLDVSAFSTPTRLLTPHGHLAARPTAADTIDWEPSGTGAGLLNFSDDDGESYSDGDSDKEAQAKARSIFKAMSGQGHLGLLAVPSSALLEPSTPSQGSKRARDEGNEANGAGDPPTKRSSLRTPETGEHLSMMSPVPPSLAGVKSPETDGSIPRTMRDIYKLSNENRRRNKDTKKKSGDKEDEPESSKLAVGDVYMFDNENEDGQDTKASATSFMQDIGWIPQAPGGQEVLDQEGKTDGDDGQAEAVRGKKGKTAPAGQRAPPVAFTPYDYSQAPTLAPAQPKGPKGPKGKKEQSDNFNPYSDKNQPEDKRVAKPKLGGRGQARSFTYANKSENKPSRGRGGRGGGGGGRGR
jgi:exosome complex exonuclease RRP6